MESNSSMTHGHEAKGYKALLDGLITLSGAEGEEGDMRAELQYCTKRAIFYNKLQSHETEIRSLVASHCGLASSNLVQVPEMVEPVNGKLVWLHGSFNVCIPVHVKNLEHSIPSKMCFRVPLPYKIGEETFPGNADEKLRTEAATYIWIDENCPNIPIPKLRGFGVAGGLSFFRPQSLPIWQRIKSYSWRLFCRLNGRSRFCSYIPQKRATFLDNGYLLTDWIENENERMLSDTFLMPHTEAQTQNLYRSLARIMISLTKIPHSRIGSWTINDNGQMSLSNRPMLCHLHQLENWSIQTSIPRSMTYTSADSFYLDLLAGHDNRLHHQPNAAFGDDDARSQATILLLMRAILHQFTHRDLSSGPFVMQLTDIHPRNIFVDTEWNIKHIIDLEWACSLPLENLLPPYWLTGKAVDQIEDKEYERFKASYKQFTDIFRQEEINQPLSLDGNIHPRASIMYSALEGGYYWYLNALQTPKGLFNLFSAHLAPKYDKAPKGTLVGAVSNFWTLEMSSFVGVKMKDLNQYRQEVRDTFNSRRSGALYQQ